MTERQKIFADEYLIDLNATRAYKVAYPNVKNDETARANSSRLLTNANVTSYIAERMKERQERTEVTQDKVIRELAAIAFSDTTDYVNIIEKQAEYIVEGVRVPLYDDDGEPMMIKRVEPVLTETLTTDQKRALASIKEGRSGIEIKAHDKVKALELLGRHLGMWNDKLALEGTVKLEDLL